MNLLRADTSSCCRILYAQQVDGEDDDDVCFGYINVKIKGTEDMKASNVFKLTRGFMPSFLGRLVLLECERNDTPSSSRRVSCFPLRKLFVYSDVPDHQPPSILKVFTVSLKPF